MAKYILNRNRQDSQSGLNYELHNETASCEYLPHHQNRLDVGYFNSCHQAMAAARQKYPQYASSIDGCRWCSPDCHTE